MATAFSYKETKVTTMKIAGIIDTDVMSIEVDGVDKSLSTLLSPFQGAQIEINVKIKDEIELDEPSESEE